MKKKSTKNKEQDQNWEEKVVQVKRVTKVVKGGKKLSFRAILVVGNERGQIGVGIGKASDVIGAVKKGVTDAKKHIINIPLTKSYSIPHPIEGISGAAKVIIKPSAIGSGVIAGGSTRIVLELAGVKNILAKQLRSDNTLNNARAVLNALGQLRTFKEAAENRDIDVVQLYKL
uniref:Small ribosomal subunit protein uS5c n=2 Tax=Gracilariopsis TaxID=2781 RepID=A0A1C9CFB1_9FLOR|nr:ribosomal protein S5 [Gracilariopsis lemaneiformis]YP_009294784.1 ribosomal protein S5 [Gracilariopsis chorda]AJO68425.1 ribosomal protein S5 [Gracilariopsis lemaneiformis]AML79921.1 ribosomal protein S5 [Gracilariopsis lemaneiformis]AOM67044.1 ribosomal protein S5 [Gracilariopsis chorda]UAD88897.1 ribosomal protein S5 [Gracilariopsis chorda]